MRNAPLININFNDLYAYIRECNIYIYNRQDVVGQFAKTLMYTDVHKFFTWNKQSKSWDPRKRGIPVPGFADIFMTNTLGRLYTVHPKQQECFFLRLLLVNVPGSTSIQYLRKVTSTLYDTFLCVL